MKLYKYIAVAFAATALVACNDFTEVVPQGGTLLASQVTATTSVLSERADATFTGMFTNTSLPLKIKFSSKRPDNFGFAMMHFSNDLECADIIMPNSDYNWFSTCGALSSRNADYANPYIRYKTPYSTIADANDVIKSYPADSEDPAIQAKIGQAMAMRAYAYLNIAPYYQFTYVAAKDSVSVPIVTETTEDFTNNPRATMKEIYDLILKDLDGAIQRLHGYTRPDKAKIDSSVAYGLRARAYLDMGEYEKAAADAAIAAAGYTPASIEEVSVPSFKDINEHNWIWGYDMTPDIANIYPYATSSSWIRSFSGNAYTPACQCYAMINKILYDKIAATDVRKGWWVDDNLESPLLKGLVWPGANADGVPFVDVANADDGGDTKTPYLPYTNVKFGCYSVGTTTNDEDWPFMRVEEMILIQAEGLYKSGKQAEGIAVLENFVKTYRDPSYSFAISAAGKGSDADEFWFQRRVELWGEGFANTDTRRLQKPMVRFHKDTKSESNVPAAFMFNLTVDDPWWLLHFPTDEKNTNLAIVDNTGGEQPTSYQNGELKDGVTD